MKNENTEKHYTKQPDSCLGCTVFFISFVISCLIGVFLGSWTGVITIPLFLFIGNKIVKKIQAKEKNESVKKEQSAEHKEIAIQEEKIKSNRDASLQENNNLEKYISKDAAITKKIRSFYIILFFVFSILCFLFFIILLFMQPIKEDIGKDVNLYYKIHGEAKFKNIKNDIEIHYDYDLNTTYEYNYVDIAKIKFIPKDIMNPYIQLQKKKFFWDKTDIIPTMTVDSFKYLALAYFYSIYFDMPIKDTVNKVEEYNYEIIGNGKRINSSDAYRKLCQILDSDYCFDFIMRQNDIYIGVEDFIWIGTYVITFLLIIIILIFGGIKIFPLLSKPQMIFVLFSILSLILLGIVMAGKYDFSYVFLRIIVSISMIGFLLDKFPIWYKFLIGINLILYNPIIQIHLDDEDDWMIFNWITFILIMLSIIIISVKVVKNKKVNSLNQ